jgi:hypothetical protein
MVGGGGLNKQSARILEREEIDGAALFKLTDAKLKKLRMPLGAREKLLAAIACLREPLGKSACCFVARRGSLLLSYVVCLLNFCSQPSGAITAS